MQITLLINTSIQAFNAQIEIHSHNRKMSQKNQQYGLFSF